MMLPRTLQIVGGIAVSTYSVLTMACGLAMFAEPEQAHPMARALLGMAIEAGALWAFIKGADLLFGRRTQGGLIGARALRIIAGGYAALLAGALLFAVDSQPPLAKIMAASGGAVLVWCLLAIARRRQAIKDREERSRLRA